MTTSKNNGTPPTLKQSPSSPKQSLADFGTVTNGSFPRLSRFLPLPFNSFLKSFTYEELDKCEGAVDEHKEGGRAAL